MMTWNEVVALVTVVMITVGIILDVGIRVISYTRNRQKDFYTLSNKVSLLKEQLDDFIVTREAFVKEFQDIQGIIRKAGLYKRGSDSNLPK